MNPDYLAQSLSLVLFYTPWRTSAALTAVTARPTFPREGRLDVCRRRVADSVTNISN